MNLFASPAPRREGSIFDRSTLLRNETPVFVIGAVNMDLSGTPADTLRMGDSNPGKITLSPGGVGRNIAENLRLLGRKVSLITIMGEDTYADVIREHCLNAGIDLQYSFTDPLGRTSAYLCINEQNGDLSAAVSDMTICEELTPDKLEQLLPVLNRGSMVIADANLPEETLAWIAKNVTVPVAADPVSVSKAPRLLPLLSRLTLLKPNIPEAELLTGMTIRGDLNLSRAADALHRLGVKRVYISLGSRGVWADDVREGGMMIPCAPGAIVNTTGCGDAFVAAAADAFLNGLDTMEAARRALAASAICAEDNGAVSPKLSQEAIEIKLAFPV
ncbi:MAG: carbohydrate kinase family protein [Clostridia bacterium]|nr:carbohydrate kinase family protein [Clostridia bacterium]